MLKQAHHQHTPYHDQSVITIAYLILNELNIVINISKSSNGVEISCLAGRVAADQADLDRKVKRAPTLRLCKAECCHWSKNERGLLKQQQ